MPVRTAAARKREGVTGGSQVVRGVGSTAGRWIERVSPLDEKPGKTPFKRLAYRPSEVAAMVGMSKSGVRNMIRRGTLRAVRWDGRWLVPASAIEEKLGVRFDSDGLAETAKTAEADRVPA